MSSLCSRCKTPLANPLPRFCPSCGMAVVVPVALASPPSVTPNRPDLTLKAARLVGKLDGKPVEFSLAARATLGRHPSNSIKLVDREVSKEHAIVERQGAGYLVRDLGSSNGTFVNGRRITEMRLVDGDEVAVGTLTLTFRHMEPVRPVQITPSVTVIGSSATSAPAFLAQLEQKEDGEFRSAEQIADPVALRQDYEKLRIAHEFQRQVGQERDEKSLFDKILQVAFQLLPADNGVIFLSQADGTLTPAAVHHRKEAQEVVLSDTVLQRVVDTRQGVLTADAIVDSRFSAAESIVAQGIRSAMAVPLLIKGALRGVLFMDTRVRTNAFSEKDLRILSGVSSQASVALENLEMSQQIEREAITRAELSRFLSPAVADAVVRGEVELLRQGRLAEVSVLFADIRGFTSMSEREQPQEIVGMLNEFFTAMATVVFRHEGNLDKFIGDCVMAVWGPPQPHDDDPARAVRAALEMQTALRTLNENRQERGKPPIEIGIGVNTGQAVVGYMGSTERHEFTAIGDSVNTASRLCSMAQAGEVLATEATVQRAGPFFEAEPLPLSRVKGKDIAIRTYRISGAERTDRGDP